ncbi:hypothetical protein HEP87_61465 [Streptomyces sp. S1D4-11]
MGILRGERGRSAFDLDKPNAWAASSTLAVPLQVARMCSGLNWS